MQVGQEKPQIANEGLRALHASHKNRNLSFGEWQLKGFPSFPDHVLSRNHGNTRHDGNWRKTALHDSLPTMRPRETLDNHALPRPPGEPTIHNLNKASRDTSGTGNSIRLFLQASRNNAISPASGGPLHSSRRYP